MRPSNDFVQVIYCAFSSLRACTLRLPSEVLSRALSSLNVSASFTASALTMPSRTRSWIRRSRSAARKPPRSLRSGWATASDFLAAPGLATIFPGDDHTQHDVQPAEPRRHAPVPPSGGSEQRHRAGDHEAQPHHGDDADREGAARDEARS